MTQGIAEPPFTSINRRIVRLASASGQHRLLTDAVIASLAAAVGVVGLVMQGRLTPAALAYCAALCLPLLLRHRDARLCFALVALVALLQWFRSGPQLADVSVLVALYWVCLEASARSISLALVAAEAGAVMLALRWEHEAQFKYWVGVTGVAVAAGALGLMVRQRRALLYSLEERAQRLERERDQQAALGAAAERARIAREMHDIVSHNLTVMIALADGARYALGADSDRAAGAIERVSSTGRRALVEMRRLLGVLREGSEPEPLEPQPTLARLEELVTRVRAAGVPVEVALEGTFADLAPGLQLTLFRVAQEALTNTLKHTARPAQARLELARRGSVVELAVTSTGAAAASVGRKRGRDPGAEPGRGGRDAGAEAGRDGGRGLPGMLERAHAYGGDLEAGPLGDGRWRVRLRLPADTDAHPQPEVRTARPLERAR